MPKRKLPRGGGTQVALSPELSIAAIGIFLLLQMENLTAIQKPMP